MSCMWATRDHRVHVRVFSWLFAATREMTGLPVMTVTRTDPHATPDHRLATMPAERPRPFRRTGRFLRLLHRPVLAHRPSPTFLSVTRNCRLWIAACPRVDSCNASARESTAGRVVARGSVCCKNAIPPRTMGRPPSSASTGRPTPCNTHRAGGTKTHAMSSSPPFARSTRATI